MVFWDLLAAYVCVAYFCLVFFCFELFKNVKTSLGVGWIWLAGCNLQKPALIETTVLIMPEILFFMLEGSPLCTSSRPIKRKAEGNQTNSFNIYKNWEAVTMGFPCSYRCLTTAIATPFTTDLPWNIYTVETTSVLCREGGSQQEVPPIRKLIPPPGVKEQSQQRARLVPSSRKPPAERSAPGSLALHTAQSTQTPFSFTSSFQQLNPLNTFF